MMDDPGPLRPATVTVTIATVLFGAKLVIAWTSGSIGLLSTAIDSGLDMAMSVLVLVGIFLARRPADRDHPYGHGKFESVTGLVEAGVLAAAGVLVAFFGIQRIQDPRPITLDAWMIVVLLATILVGIERGVSLTRHGDEHRSPALSVDAWHYASDAVTGSVALAGAWLAARGWMWADGASAVVVGVFLALGSVHVGWRATADLVDRVPPGLTGRVQTAIEGVGEVEGTPQVRVREAGPDVFVDATVEVPRSLDLQKAHDVMDEVEAAVRGEIEDADVVVHAEPVAGRESVATTLEVLASRSPAILGVHEVFVDRLGDEVVVDCHVEVDEAFTLREAHEEAQAFEELVKREIEAVSGVRTHIEPVPLHPREGEDVTEDHPGLVSRIEQALGQDPFDATGPVVLKRVGGSLEAIVTVRMASELSLRAAHEAADRVERELLEQEGALARVVVHVEPSPAR